MKTSVEWIDEAELRLGLSDYAMAKKLGLSTAQMSRYRTGKQFLSDNVAIKLAELIGVDPLPILATAAAERATSEQARAAWSRYAELVASLAGVAVLGAVLTAPIEAKAQVSQDSDCILCQLGRRKNRQRKRTRSDISDICSKPGSVLPGFFSPDRQPAI